MDTIRIAGIANDSIVDGPGIRFAVFLQGCPHECPACQNPETWPMDGGELTTTEELLAQIDANPLLTGVTLSGGEPLVQAKALLPLAKAVAQERGLDLAIYTGYTFEEIMGERDAAVLLLLSYASVLVDGRFVEKEKSLALPFRGSKNQRILDLPRSLKEGRAVETKDSRWLGKNA